MRRCALLLLLPLLVQACSGPRKNKTTTDAPPGPGKSKDITLFLTTELQGTIEPCGCNSDPLGDLARTARLISQSRTERPTILLDGGSTLYSLNPVPEKMRQQEQLKAKLLVEYLPELGLAAVGLGPYDLGDGKANVKLPRQAVNVPASAGVPLEPPKVIEVGDARVGVFGVVAPAALASAGITAGDPIAAAKKAITDLRAQGAQIVVCLAHMPRKDAKQLARGAPGIDLILVGQEAPEPDRPLTPVEPVGGTFLLQPHLKGQSVLRIDLHVDPSAAAGTALVDAIGEARARTRLEKLDRDIAERSGKIAGFEQDPTADPTFVQTKRDELAAVEQERAELAAHPLRVPASGSWFTAELVLVKRALACDPAVVAAKQEFDRAVGRENQRLFADEQPAPVPAGGAGFVGGEECASCHQKAVTFWQQTKHAYAWETLVAKNKQWNRDCIGCHVTGWLEPGGSTLAVNEPYRDVQCEVCHGPASRHVDADGHEKPASLVLKPPAGRCLTCHSPEHSDTFAYEAYLRDVTGPGHGEQLRKQLGEGPTGLSLRSAALKKAGTGVGAGCAP